MVKAEMEHLRRELPDPPAFNGYYPRHLTSPIGRIESVPIPRFRDGFGPNTTPRHCRSSKLSNNGSWRIMGDYPQHPTNINEQWLTISSISLWPKRETRRNHTCKVVKKWYTEQPKAMESLRFHVEHCFTYLDFPQTEWKNIRTSNVLEREFREVRRRLKVMDSSFHDEASAKRYANTIVSNLNNSYPRVRVDSTTAAAAGGRCVR